MGYWGHVSNKKGDATVRCIPFLILITHINFVINRWLMPLLRELQKRNSCPCDPS